MRQIAGVALACALLSGVADAGDRLQGPTDKIRFDISGTGPGARQTISIDDEGRWKQALSAAEAIRVVAIGATTPQACLVESSTALQNPSGLLLRGNCGALGTFERRITISPEPDAIEVSVRFAVPEHVKVRSVEDRYDFSPPRRSSDTPVSGPLDFLWSQDIKSEPDDLIPDWCFKSPVVMMQQGRVFSALMPNLHQRQRVPLAIDLNTTSGAKPWLSYGAVESDPHDHSYFRRSTTRGPKVLAGFVEYSYSIVASAQPEKLGYRRVVRRLWEQLGHPNLMASADLQRNVVRPNIELFDDWRREAWTRYADEVYHEFDCGGKRCGTLASNRNFMGEWDNQAPDAWFNSWFQTLRTAYGWYLYGRQTRNQEMQRRAETILNLALTSPQHEGAFPTIYLLKEKRWVRDDGWAGFPDDYHAFCMSWTAYWMLRWADDLVPQRKTEILAFVRPYGDFLASKQLHSGAIPSWYDASLNPRAEFRDFNAETAGSALLLAELARETGQSKYQDAAARAMGFVTNEVRPRQRWFDFETFKSCARKNFGFYDRWTAQYPQNNLSTIQAASAYLALYRLTKNADYLEQGTQTLDYLLLTQQVWNNPAFSPKLVGGFTTQNTDAEWSDARQCYAAELLWNFYQATGNPEYLERAVAAARSTFSVAPWENWAHIGYGDEPGAMTGFHWSTGSAMTSIEILYPQLGDIFVDLEHRAGVGFNATSIRDLTLNGNSISFHLDSLERLRTATVRFAGVNQSADYNISWNNHPAQSVSGAVLAREGFRISP